MLAKKHRLTRAEFNRFFSSGRRTHSPEFTIIYAPHERFHGAVVVGKKVYKKAVDRNRLRRRVYSALYRWQQQSGTTGVFIIITKPASQALTQKQLAPTVQAILERVVKDSKKR